MPKEQMLYGYDVDVGYVGWVAKLDQLILFSCYRDYVEYVKEN